MKKPILIVMAFIASVSFAQEKMMTKTGKVTFEASVPAFEEIKGKNENATGVLVPATGEFASLTLMKGFRFKIALMEEHFNENYVQSDKYPKATFRGKIENFDVKSLTATAKDYTIKGKMELHGKSKEISVPAKIKKTDAGIEISSTFNINTEDFDIEIPSVVASKVSKKVIIKSDFIVK